MVGRLVEEEDVRLRRHQPRQRRAPCFTARQVRRIGAAGEPEMLDQIGDPPGVVRRSEA